MGCAGSKEEEEPRPQPKQTTASSRPQPSAEELERRKRDQEEEKKWVEVARQQNPPPFDKPVLRQGCPEEEFKEHMRQKYEYEQWENKLILIARKLMQDAKNGNGNQTATAPTINVNSTAVQPTGSSLIPASPDKQNRRSVAVQNPTSRTPNNVKTLSRPSQSSQDHHEDEESSEPPKAKPNPNPTPQRTQSPPKAQTASPPPQTQPPPDPSNGTVDPRLQKLIAHMNPENAEAVKTFWDLWQAGLITQEDFVARTRGLYS
eukprot:TRINITY_DN2289_c0_g1_i1.p1 TRINITY_DN2289_c0_g1~~TRINITY_DN2289_c0_g1_i1.p1  ORF type:complete len:261 (-),score=69.06 TRINITY_DN2289_c0_g1_i1:209-991(-)